MKRERQSSGPNISTPLIATVQPMPNGARLSILDPQNGVEAAILWVKDLAYAGMLAAAINDATHEHFNGGEQPS